MVRPGFEPPTSRTVVRFSTEPTGRPFRHGVQFVSSNRSSSIPDFIIVGSILFWVLEKIIIVWVQFFHAKLQGSVSIVLVRSFVHSCQFFGAGFLSQFAGIVLRDFIMHHCDIFFFPATVDFKLKAGEFQIPLAFSSSTTKETREQSGTTHYKEGKVGLPE